MTSMRNEAPTTAAADTIAAFATAIGGPIAIIRISGAGALAVTGQVWHGTRPLPELQERALHLGRLQAANTEIDRQAIAVFMRAPRSYTGEDMVELHCHGGPLGARLALLQVLRSGARHAAPGEFSRRAFVNGKMDLTQAEAVADLISAHSEAALRLANRQLAGRLRTRLDDVDAALERLLGEAEARLDFPDEDLDFLSPAALETEFGNVRETVGELLASRHTGNVLREGVALVIAGPPNVGKSSLLNTILGRDRAIVTSIPGTTRDTLEELAHIRGIPARLVDTAGIREVDGDPAEESGIARSFASIATAELVLWVIDGSKPYAEQACSPVAGDTAVLLVANKCDLGSCEEDDIPAELEPPLRTCALDGTGLEVLFDAIERVVWDTPRPREPEVAVSARHAARLEVAAAELTDAGDQVRNQQWELVSVALRNAQTAIGGITGRTASLDVLDTIFARFCIGK